MEVCPLKMLSDTLTGVEFDYSCFIFTVKRFGRLLDVVKRYINAFWLIDLTEPKSLDVKHKTSQMHTEDTKYLSHFEAVDCHLQD